jgi:hypothetical protein
MANARAKKGPTAGQREIHHRPCLDPLGRDEQRERDNRGSKLQQGRPARPAGNIAVDERPDQAEQATTKEHHARKVEPEGVGIARLFHDGDGQCHQHDANRDIDEKSPAPAEAGGDDTANDRAKRDGDTDHGPPETEGAGAIVPTELMAQNRQRGTELQGRADALQRPRHIEDEGTRRQAAEQGRKRENREPGQGGAAATVTIGRRTRWHQQGGKSEDVGADHPFDVGERRTKITRDRW